MNMYRNSLLAALALLAAPAALFAQPLAGRLAEETAVEYRKQARYPASSTVLEAGAVDPIRAKRQPNVVVARAPEGEGPALSVWPAKVSFQHPEPVVLFAALDAAVPVKARSIGAEIVDAAGEVVGEVAFFDDGVGSDALALDGLWTGTFTFPPSYRPQHADSFAVRFDALLGDGEVRHATGGFLYSRPAAKLSGRYRDLVVDGNLVIRTTVEVEEAARFHLAGTLYTLAGEPIGTAQQAARLEPGQHVIDLVFYGLMFHDRDVEGPFRLGTVAFSTAGRMPNALNDLVLDAHITRPYRTDRFLDRFYDRSDLLQAADRLQIEAAGSSQR